MTRLKRTIALSLTLVFFIMTNGFAMNSVRCMITGQTQKSVISQKCCCNTNSQATHKKCCERNTKLYKLNTKVVKQEIDSKINPIFLSSFVTINYLSLNVFENYDSTALNYFNQSHPIYKKETIILFQSFLI